MGGITKIQTIGIVVDLQSSCGNRRLVKLIAGRRSRTSSGFAMIADQCSNDVTATASPLGVSDNWQQ